MATAYGLGRIGFKPACKDLGAQPVSSTAHDAAGPVLRRIRASGLARRAPAKAAQARPDSPERCPIMGHLPHSLSKNGANLQKALASQSEYTQRPGCLP